MPFPRQDVEFVGNLGRDAEMRYTPQGQPVTQFSLAVTRQWGQGDAKKKETIWVTVSTWEKLAEACARLEKGQQVFVKGYLKPDPATGGPRIWEGREGKTGASYELTAQEVWLSMFGKTGESAQADQFAGAPGVYDDADIPF